jgi:hypothetical protein
MMPRYHGAPLSHWCDTAHRLLHYRSMHVPRVAPTRLPHTRLHTSLPAVSGTAGCALTPVRWRIEGAACPHLANLLSPCLPPIATCTPCATPPFAPRAPSRCDEPRQRAGWASRRRVCSQRRRGVRGRGPGRIRSAWRGSPPPVKLNPLVRLRSRVCCVARGCRRAVATCAAPTPRLT